MIIKKFTFLILINFILFIYSTLQTFHPLQPLVLINPAGDANNPGRRLVEGYERSQTFKLAECLKDELQKKYNVRCVLTRYPGEHIVDLQNASFSNRLGVDFYLSLHIYSKETLKPELFAYHLVYNPIVDFASRIIDPYSFLSIYHAHYKNIHKTHFIGKYIRDTLTLDYYKKNFDFYGIYGIPLRPLCGIIAPAIAIEIGICEEQQWKSLVEPIVESLGFLVKGSYL